MGGGCVIGSGIHRLDLLRWYLGEAKEVYALTTKIPERLDAEAICSSTIKFESGAKADFHCNWGILKYPYCETLGLYARDGLILCDNQTVTMGQANVDGGELKEIKISLTVSMVDHFAQCIYSNKTPLTDGNEGIKSLELVMSIYKSVAKQTSVLL